MRTKINKIEIIYIFGATDTFSEINKASLIKTYNSSILRIIKNDFEEYFIPLFNVKSIRILKKIVRETPLN